MHRDPTRRMFLQAVSGALLAPALLAGCRPRRGAGGPPTTSPVPEDVNLDEVPEAAVFRPPLPAVEPLIRVRVLKVRGPSTAILVGAANQWIQMRRPGAGDKGLAMAGPVTIAIEADEWSLIDGQGFRAPVNGRESIELISMAGEGSRLLEVREISPPAPLGNSPSPAPPRQYPGILRLFSRHDLEPGAFDLINDVPIETYLPGVLAGELYKHWHVQTFAAQSVAARSFAATEIAVFAGKRHYDVTNTASSQMYLGNVRDSRAHEAVQMTRGLVLGYGGLLVSGYYSSCCGGAAASATDAIGSNPVNDVAPLVGRPEPDVCTAAPVFQWKVEQPIELISRRLIAFGKERRLKDLANFTRLESVEVIARNANGRPTRVRVMDIRQAAVELSAENFRRAANYSGQGLAPPDKPLRSSNLRVSVKRDTVIFEGFGFGHGVGLCQYGAETLAKSGKHHTEILRWYYPGVELVQAYG